MNIFYTQDELKSFLQLKAKDKSVGFVPTMGALHEGHLSLIRTSKTDTDLTVCSIFVNPTQFNESADFENYPVTIDADIELLESVNCDILYLPKNAEDVYKNEVPFSIETGVLSEVMEGKNRPGHFDGVMRVVKLLLEIVEPDKAYFGLKDFQQYAIIKNMVKQLDMKVDVVGCPIVREKSGLAMSSRNALLSEEDKKKALIIYQTLKDLQDKVQIGDVTQWVEKGLEQLQKNTTPEYLTIAESETLLPVSQLEKEKKYRAFAVARIGGVRLIDNIEIFV